MNGEGGAGRPALRCPAGEGATVLPTPRVIELGPGRASYLQAGPPDAPGVLLLHGGGLDCASLSWRILLPRLARRRFVVAPDWPGCGNSTSLGRPHTIADLGVWLVALMEALGIERARVVGVSMGGGVALWLALHHPERVERLVAVSTYGLQERAPHHRLSWLATRLPLGRLSHVVLRRSRRAARAALGAIFADPARVGDALGCEVRRVLAAGADPSTFSHFQAGEVGWDRLSTVLAPRVHEIAQPTLLIHGVADRLVPLAEVRRAAGRMPDASLAVLDAGHWPMRERPGSFNALVERFV